LAFTYDPARSRLVVVAPHVLDGRDPTHEEGRNLVALDRALQGLRELRAGPAGRVALRPAFIDVDTDALTAPCRVWESATPYVVTRHAHMGDPTAALAANLRAECRRRGLPEPAVTPIDVQALSGIGLGGRARLVFPVATSGPVLLGKNRYLGGGLFSGVSRDCR
jgi:CRISPR-associated protein Csb2